jgi:hypothetical protein
MDVAHSPCMLAISHDVIYCNLKPRPSILSIAYLFKIRKMTLTSLLSLSLPSLLLEVLRLSDMYQISDLHEECRASLKSFKMSSQNYAEVFKVAMQYENFNGFEVRRSAYSTFCFDFSFSAQCGSGFGSREPNQCGTGSRSDFKVTKS